MELAFRITIAVAVKDMRETLVILQVSLTCYGYSQISSDVLQ